MYAFQAGFWFQCLLIGESCKKTVSNYEKIVPIKESTETAKQISSFSGSKIDKALSQFNIFFGGGWFQAPELRTEHEK